MSLTYKDTEMPTRLEKAGGISELLSSKSSRRLEQIADLRARGIGDHISLPQLVVCGDQSTGKSSVLEGLTGIPFPRQDGICTRFATEIILRHTADEMEIVATVLPAHSRSDEIKGRMRSYLRRLSSFEELPTAISEAGQLMGIRGFGDIKHGPAFAEDVLRIEVSGPIGLHLTVVDLPGLISSHTEEQSEEDVETVHALVDSYVQNPRTIILAVVQAGNDISNQPIIRKSRHYDKTGKRTVGIITKPDLINKGTEGRIALLAKNQDTTKLNLGYFILVNPTPAELKDGITPEQRHANETRFFRTSPWKEQSLDKDRVGILALRSYLQTLLDQHIERELPRVREEISSLLKQTQEAVLELGTERPTAGQRRMFLSRLATGFHNLTASALNGAYHEADATFFESSGLEESTRLRALVHKLNTEFANLMREHGAKRKIVARSPTDSGDDSEDSWKDLTAKPGESNPQILVTESQMRAWVKQIYVSSRGKELPGNYNHVLLSELFFKQSSRWYDMAIAHVDKTFDRIELFIRAALCHIVKDEQIQGDIAEISNSVLKMQKKEAESELEKIYQDERQQPITYNHYYTDNVQKARDEATRRLIQKAMREAREQDWGGKMHVSNNELDANKLLVSLQNRIIVNMDEQACAEALDGLQAYYKVALKTFVDNVCRQVIERHLLRGLPQIFCPETVAGLSEEDLERIAAETPAQVRKRKELVELQEQLQDSLRDLRR